MAAIGLVFDTQVRRSLHAIAAFPVVLVPLPGPWKLLPLLALLRFVATGNGGSCSWGQEGLERM